MIQFDLRRRGGREWTLVRRNTCFELIKDLAEFNVKINKEMLFD